MPQENPTTAKPQKQVSTPPAAERLLDALPDAHLVRCRADKRATDNGWQKQPATLARIKSHPPARLGIIPASVGLTAVDCDARYLHGEAARDAAQAKLGEPLAAVRTPGGGWHLFYKAPDRGAVANHGWAYGDLRGSRGYVVVYDADAIMHAASEAGAADAPDLAKLPQRPIWRNWKTFQKLAKATEGERNDALNAFVFDAASHGLEHRAVSEARHLASVAGLSEAEINRTIRSGLDKGHAAAGADAEQPRPAPGEAAEPAPADAEPAPRRWRWLSDVGQTPADGPPAVAHGLLWRGRFTILHSREKVGKSTLVGHALAAVTCGGEFLGQPTEAGRVLLVTEEAAEDVHSRIVQAGGDAGRIAVMPPAALADVEGALNDPDLADVRAVCVDTLSALASASGEDDMGGSGGVGALVNRLVALSRERGVAVLLTHHNKKNETGAYRDSTAIGAAADQLVSLERCGAGAPHARRLKYIGRWHVEPLAVTLGGDGFEVDPDAAASGQRDDLPERILDVLREAVEPLSTAAVQTAAGCRRADLNAALDALLQSGDVARSEGKHKAKLWEISTLSQTPDQGGDDSRERVPLPTLSQTLSRPFPVGAERVGKGTLSRPFPRPFPVPPIGKGGKGSSDEAKIGGSCSMPGCDGTASDTDLKLCPECRLSYEAEREAPAVAAARGTA